MTRISKQNRERHQCPKKRKLPSPKTGPKKDNLPAGFKNHANVLESKTIFIPKIKGKNYV